MDDELRKYLIDMEERIVKRIAAALAANTQSGAAWSIQAVADRLREVQQSHAALTQQVGEVHSTLEALRKLMEE